MQINIGDLIIFKNHKATFVGFVNNIKSDLFYITWIPKRHLIFEVLTKSFIEHSLNKGSYSHIKTIK